MKEMKLRFGKPIYIDYRGYRYYRGISFILEIDKSKHRKFKRKNVDKFIKITRLNGKLIMSWENTLKLVSLQPMSKIIRAEKQLEKYFLD